MEWKTVKLGDIVRRKIGYGIVQPGESRPCGVPVIKVNNIIAGLTSVDDLEKTTEEIECKYQRTRLQGGELIISLVGSVGNTAIVPKSFKGCNLVRATGLIDIEDPFLTKWVKYYIDSPLGQYYIKSNLNTTVQATLNVKSLVDMPIPMPDSRIIGQIVAVLSSLDDKIENNNRINANLEAQAQAVFKSWFVDFEPFGGVLPEDWEETTIGEICKCYLGGTPSRAKAEYWNGEIPWINSGEVNKYRILEGSEYITELGLQKSATKLLPRKTTVLAITGATLGQVSLLEIEACANQSVIGIVQNEKVPYEFIYPLILNDIEQIMLHQTGGAQQHINKDNVESHKLILPTDEVMAKYKAIQAPLFETIANNCFESQRLAALRDTLLPKLMKGEIAL